MRTERPNIEEFEVPTFEDELEGIDEPVQLQEENVKEDEINEAENSQDNESPKQQAKENEEPKIESEQIETEGPHPVRAKGRITKRFDREAIQQMTLQRAGEIIDELIKDGTINLEKENKSKGTGTLYASIEKHNFTLVNKLTGEVHVIQGSVKVGRNPNHAEIVPDGNRTVSTEHAMLTDRKGTLLVRDLGSTNGTFVNDVRIASNQNIELTKGDVVTFSNAEYVVDQIANS